MKKNLLLLLSIVTLIGSVNAQIKKLYDFPFDEPNIYFSNPQGRLNIMGNKIFGTTAYGPALTNYGYVYTFNLSNNTFTNIHQFICAVDACQPVNGMVFSGGKFYGALGQDGGGPTNSGTIYKFDTTTKAVTRLYSFNGGTDGKYASGPVTVIGNTIYGTCLSGGSINNGGTLWRLGTDGTGFKVLYNFKGGFGYGAAPNAELIMVDSVLYGTTSNDGDSFNTPQPVTDGTIYSFDLRKNKYTLLKKFDGSTGGKNPNPYGMVLINNVLYGTCAFKGANDAGNLFSYNLTTKTFSVIHEFNVTDGSSPRGFTVNGTKLYGTTYYGGANGHGVIYSYNTANAQFKTLAHFKHDSTGAWPWDPPTIVGNTLYGTCTIGGGTKVKGTLWKFVDTSIKVAPNSTKTITETVKVSVYPNPSNSEIQVSADQLIQNIVISSADGKVIKKIMSLKEMSSKIDISEMKNGVYFMEVKFADSRTTKQIIKI